MRRSCIALALALAALSAFACRRGQEEVLEIPIPQLSSKSTAYEVKLLRARVEAVEGVRAVTVDQKEGMIAVHLRAPVAAEEIERAITEAGFFPGGKGQEENEEETAAQVATSAVAGDDTEPLVPEPDEPPFEDSVRDLADLPGRTAAPPPEL